MQPINFYPAAPNQTALSLREEGGTDVVVRGNGRAQHVNEDVEAGPPSPVFFNYEWPEQRIMGPPGRFRRLISCVLGYLFIAVSWIGDIIVKHVEFFLSALVCITIVSATVAVALYFRSNLDETSANRERATNPILG